MSVRCNISSAIDLGIRSAMKTSSICLPLGAALMMAALLAAPAIAWATGGRAEGRRACEKEARACPRDVYVYFDNDAKVRAPVDAMGLEKKVVAKLAER